MTSPRFLRHRCTLLGALLLLVPVIGQAQTMPESKTEAPAPRRVASGTQGGRVAPGEAKALALRTSGVVRDPLSGEMMIGGVLHVKIVKGEDAVSTALAVGTAAGLQPMQASVTGVVAFLPAVEAVRTKKTAPAMENRRELAQLARTDLLSLVELRYAAPISPRDAADRLRAVVDVEYAEPIMVPRLLGAVPNDPLIPEQPHLPLIHAFEAWNLWRGDTATLIGVVDAGIDNSHEDLVPSIAVNVGESGVDGSGNDRRTNKVDDDGNGVVDDWRGANLAWRADGTLPSSTSGSAHGTQVAGLAAAATNNSIGVAGTAYGCRMIPVKAASNNNGYLSYAYEGVMYCAVRGCRVINCSFGSNSYSQAEQDIIDVVTRTYNCAIVAAGGNEYTYAGFYPAAYNGVLGVGALDTSGVYRSTWGEHIDLATPTGTSTNDGNGYTPLGPATSYTAPIVSGALALVRSRWPQLSALQAGAHVRWACDSLRNLPVALREYTGAGQLNMGRALEVDPFTHPAVILDSVTLLDTTGAVSEQFMAGQRGALRLLLRNLLGPATGVRVRARIMGEDTMFLRLDSAWVTVGQLATGVLQASEPIPFRTLRRSSLPLRVQLEVAADAGYHDAWTTQIRFSIPYITVQTAQLRVSLTDAGRLGTDGLPGTAVDGIQYKGSSMLFEGGVMMGTDADHVVSNVRHDDGEPDASLATIEFPSAANDSTTTLSDSEAGTRMIGLELAMRLLVHAGVDDAFGLQLVVHNRRPSVIDTLQVAMFADWDLGGVGGGQSVRLGEQSVPKVGLYGVIEDTQQGGAVVHGLASPVTAPIFMAFRNDSLMLDTQAGIAVALNDGFDRAEKWWSLSHTIGTRNAGAGTPNQSDVSLVIGRSVVELDVDGRDTLLFVFGFGANQKDATDAMERFLVQGSAEVPPSSSDVLLSVPFPQPAADRCLVQVRGQGLLQLFDAAGRQIADFSQNLQGNTNERLLVIDTHTLPSGRYLLSFSTSTRRVVQPLVIAR